MNVQASTVPGRAPKPGPSPPSLAERDLLKKAAWCDLRIMGDARAS